MAPRGAGRTGGQLSLVGKTVVSVYNSGYGGVVLAVTFDQTDRSWKLLLRDIHNGQLFETDAEGMEVVPDPVPEPEPLPEAPFK